MQRSRLPDGGHVHGEEVFGTVEFFFMSKPVKFSQEKIDFASKLAAGVSLVINNAGLVRGSFTEKKEPDQA